MTRLHIPSHKLKALLSKDIQAYDTRESDDNIVIFKPSPTPPIIKIDIENLRQKSFPLTAIKLPSSDLHNVQIPK